jgi:hypothetical protein
MANENVFELQIAQFVEKAKGNCDLVVRKVALDLFSRVILKTPVDTGRLRGSWCVSIGALAPKTIELEDKTGSVTIARVTADTLGLKAGDVVYLSTTLEYAGVIEYGHSKQAPEGMVRLTILEFNRAINEAVAGLPK